MLAQLTRKQEPKSPKALRRMLRAPLQSINLSKPNITSISDIFILNQISPATLSRKIKLSVTNSYEFKIRRVNLT
jgi:hypothetical protein